LSFAPEETNLVMARLELDRFIFTQGLLLPRRGSQDAPRQAP
jgi:hypothetical protein